MNPPSAPHATPRRTLFGAAALLALATPARAADHNPDAPLIAACAEFEKLERQFCTTDFNADSDTPEGRAADTERERINRLQDPLVERICLLRATTLAGHVARARSLALWDPELLKEGPGDAGTLLASALVRDLLAGAAA